MKAAGVTFLFDSKVPKQEIAEVVEKKVCCYGFSSRARASGDALSFSGDRVFVRATVPDMQTWPKTVQLQMFHQGLGQPRRREQGVGLRGRRGRRVGQAQAPVASCKGSATALIPRPFMDYKSPPATVKAAKVSYFAKFLYPTFSHPRCTDCHSMGDAVTVNARHAAGGMPNVNAANPRWPAATGAATRRSGTGARRRFRTSTGGARERKRSATS